MSSPSEPSDMSIVLASGSAIRQKILSDAGLDFEVETRTVDEDALKGALLAENVPPRDIADALAEAKALAVSRRREADFVVGADQILVLDGRMYDKPKSRGEARERLRLLRGRTHQLLGATVVCEGGRPVWRNMARTRLTMRDFSDDFLEDYLDREGELVTRSVGAYRFEGLGAQLFTGVEGDFFAILGLDLLPLLGYLRLRGAIPS